MLGLRLSNDQKCFCIVKKKKQQKIRILQYLEKPVW